MKSRPIRAVKTCRVADIREDIAAHRDELVAPCRDYGVRRLEILGSGARGADFDEETSDADVLAKFDGDGGGSPLWQFVGFARARLCSLISARFSRRPRRPFPPAAKPDKLPAPQLAQGRRHVRQQAAGSRFPSGRQGRARAFPARRGADAQAGRGRDSRAQSFSLARSLHARPAQRRQILRQAAGDRGGDGRRDGRRGRRVRTIRASRPAISSSAWAAGSNIS